MNTLLNFAQYHGIHTPFVKRSRKQICFNKRYFYYYSKHVTIRMFTLLSIRLTFHRRVDRTLWLFSWNRIFNMGPCGKRILILLNQYSDTYIHVFSYMFAIYICTVIFFCNILTSARGNPNANYTQNYAQREMLRKHFIKWTRQHILYNLLIWVTKGNIFFFMIPIHTHIEVPNLFGYCTRNGTGEGTWTALWEGTNLQKKRKRKKEIGRLGI